MNLVLSIAIGEQYAAIAGLTNGTLKKYSEKIGADFLCITQQKISKTTPHWEKFQIYELLDKYDRIIYLDSDIIVRKDCPNLFDIIPEDSLGMFNEAPFTDRSKELMIDICRQYNIILSGWDNRYFNSGVMVISRCHKILFKKPEQEIFSYYEQTYLNAMIAYYQIKIKELDYKFNRMTCLDRYIGEDRHNSYIIHYAGFPSLSFVTDLIRRDLSRWNNGDFKYKKHIYISVSGGLGDQLCAEPAVRYMREKLYPNDEFWVATHFPELFRHLEGVNVCEQGKANLGDDTPYFIKQSLPGPETIQWAIVSHLLSHPVDYSSVALMKRTLPLEDKQIKFQLSEKDIFSLFAKTKITDFKDYVIIHPGKHWETKTFPKEWWQDVIDKISKFKKVIIIGKDEPGDPPTFIPGARGTVDVVCPKNGIDLRNKITLGELAVLLSKAKVLVSNDSAPIHLAGAFDNWIILIPSCKHPDHILPFRNKQNYYKAKALYKKLIIDEVESRPTQVYETSVDIKVDNWNNYLLPPQEVVKEIINI